MDERKQQQNLFELRALLRNGLLAGLVLLYTSMVGMVETFNNRQIVQNLITLGQVLIFAPPLVVAFVYCRRLYAGSRTAGQPLYLVVLALLVAGLVIGALASLLTLALLFIHSQINMSTIFNSVNRNWMTIITFDNREDLLRGGFLLMGSMAASGLVGALLALVPPRPRRAMFYGLGLVLVIGVMGETTRLILQQILPREALDQIIRRNVLLQPAALVLLVIGTVGGLVWVYGRDRIVGAYQSLQPSQQNAGRVIFYVFLAGLLVMLPSLIGRALSDILVTVGLYVLMGLGLNIAIGLAGLLDLGYVTNYAVGAYVMAVMTSTGTLGLVTRTGNDFFNFWIVIPIALLAAMLTGFIFAVPVLKMRGDYLAIATLGFGEIIGKLALSDWLAPLIGGPQGVLAIPNPFFFGTEIKDPEQLYYILLVACAITLFVSIRMNNSRTGRTWMAVREDEDVAAAMGINVARAKLLAFTLSAATGGVAGAIFAIKVGTIFPQSFNVFVSINVLSLIIVGGMASNPGIVLGALVLVGMPELLREFSEYRWLLYGALLIFMMINRPEGLFPSQVRRRELLSDEPPPVTAGTD